MTSFLMHHIQHLVKNVPMCMGNREFAVTQLITAAQNKDVLWIVIEMSDHAFSVSGTAFTSLEYAMH